MSNMTARALHHCFYCGAGLKAGVAWSEIATCDRPECKGALEAEVRATIDKCRSDIKVAAPMPRERPDLLAALKAARKSLTMAKIELDGGRPTYVRHLLEEASKDISAVIDKAERKS